MKHRSRAALATLLLALLSPNRVLAACPAPLPDSALRTLDPGEELSSYLMLRWLACGPKSVLTMLPILRESVHRQVQKDAEEDAAPLGPPDGDGAFVRLVIVALSMNPEEVADGFAKAKDHVEPADAHSTPEQRALIEFFALGIDKTQIRRHFEQGVGLGVEFLRQQALTPAQEQLLQLVEVKQAARQGRYDTAREQLARIAAAVPPDIAPDRDDRELLQGYLESLNEALAPVQAVSLAADAQSWVLDKTTGVPRRRTCGFAAGMEATFGASHLRADILRRADIDAAIAELLREQWHALIEGHHAEALLLELLLKRYTAAELRTGLDDAVASIRSHGGRAQLVLFGQALALPGSVEEGDASVADGTRTRELGVAELADLVRAGDLYLRLGPAALAAMSASDAE